MNTTEQLATIDVAKLFITYAALGLILTSFNFTGPLWKKNGHKNYLKLSLT